MVVLRRPGGSRARETCRLGRRPRNAGEALAALGPRPSSCCRWHPCLWLRASASEPPRRRGRCFSTIFNTRAGAPRSARRPSASRLGGFRRRVSRASPVIGADGAIYLPVGRLGADSSGYLYAIRPNGTQKWRLTLAGRLRRPLRRSPPMGPIYVHTNRGEGNLVAVERLYAVNPSDGTVKWIFEFNNGSGIFTSDVQSSPAVAADATIYVGSIDTNLYAVNSNGTLRWARSPSLSSIESSPAVASDGTVHIVDGSTTLHAYTSTGTFNGAISSRRCLLAVIRGDGTIY